MFFKPLGAHKLLVSGVVLILLIAVGGAAYALGPSQSHLAKAPASDAVATPQPTSLGATKPVSSTGSGTNKTASSTTTVPNRPAFVVAASTLNRLVSIDTNTGKTTKV